MAEPRTHFNAPTSQIDAIDAHPGDVWIGHNEATRIDAVELRDDGLVRLAGQIIEGRDRGFRGSWSVQFTQPMEVRRGS